MASGKRKPRAIDEYLAGVKADQRVALEKLRKAIHAAAPKVEECISYGIPAFRLNGRSFGFLRRLGESLLVLSEQFEDTEEISGQSARFSDYQWNHSLLA